MVRIRFTGNRLSIGIEICYSKSGGVRYGFAEENAIQYIAKLLKQYGRGIERVKSTRIGQENIAHTVFWQKIVGILLETHSGSYETKRNWTTNCRG